ncbi:MAG: NADH-quinone oxidoreductase subunit N [Anaerolineales bacterium]|nr:NADH-quinone oxidoreductase subunit N [Anaerolineales bacterium]
MEFQIPSINLLVILPVVILMAGGVLLVILDMFVQEGEKTHGGWVTAVTLGLALVQTIGLWNYSGGTFTPVDGHPMILVDKFAIFLNITFLLTGLLSVLISVNYLRRTGLEKHEYYMLMLFSIAGMMLMAMANDLILIFLALEVLSIPLYIMSGFAWPRPQSEEAAMKYFLLGAFSSGVLVFGIALTYGATGSTALPDVLAGIQSGGALGLAGAAFLLVGFGFKVAAVPFHMWTPDVYEGAPTAVTAFMSVGAKVGGFAAMLRIFVGALPALGDTWVGAIAVISALTLILGNVVAVMQSNLKRMLAYSSIAHAGYIMIAVASGVATPDGVSSALFYMFAYLFTNLGAFAVVIAMEKQQGEGISLDDLKGLAKKHPWIAIVMTYFMLSLTGIPPTGGFSGKFFVFRAALEADLLWLAIIGVITSVVSGYYYLRVVYLMYMVEGDGELTASLGIQWALGITAVATLILGFLPGAWFEITRQAALIGGQLLAGG